MNLKLLLASAWRFYLVSNGTKDTLLGATVTPNVFFSINEANLDGVDHLRVSESNAQLILEWEDLWADGGQDFNDLVLSIELATEPLSLQQLTASCQGFPEGEMLDLRGLAGQQVQAKLVVKREAAFDNFFGFYQVENEQGRIREPLEWSTFEFRGCRLHPSCTPQQPRTWIQLRG